MNNISIFFSKIGHSIKHFFKYLFKAQNENNPSYAKKFIRNNGVQSVITSLICILVGLLVGYITLLIINPEGAASGFQTILLNFLTFNRGELELKYFAKTLVNTTPLLCCALSVLFAYKAGLFNIGASGQYLVASCITLLCSLVLHLPWYVCTILAIIGGAIMGSLVGLLKAYFNVNEVISSIMLNWIALYVVNLIIKKSPAWNDSVNETFNIAENASSSLLPTLGLNNATGFAYFGIGLFVAIFFAVVVIIVLRRTVFGYELMATGFNRNGAKYAGINEKRSIILSMAISGALAGLGAPLFYLSGMGIYTCPSVVPQMGFDGISAAFLGGLNPIGAIFSSYFLQHIMSAGAKLNTDMYCSQTADLIVGVIIYLCAFAGGLRIFVNKLSNGEIKFHFKKKKNRPQMLKEDK
ncbi:MAG: ABC transporter permease [Bacilli bacterium]|nr:ABC transporter permease [Bacilli bacterium]